MEALLNYINGEFVPAADGGTLEVFAPATGRVSATIPRSRDQDVDRAVAAAQAAFPGWSGTSAAERSTALLRLAELIDESADELARIESEDSGKPLGLARAVDIPRASANFRFFATAILHTHTEAHADHDDALNYTLRRPRGVAGCISPWNLPLYLFTWKVAPALASGNTVVGKPSEITPRTAVELGRLCTKAGIPPGVLNIIHGLGPEAGEALVRHPDVPTLTFTGGTKTGARIGAAAAEQFKRVSLELGGKNPNLVFADADPDAVVRESVRAAFTNQGQICLCGSRILVEKGFYPEFLDRFTKEVQALKVGDPSQPGTDLGALVSREHKEKVQGYLELAAREGRIVTGGTEPADLPEELQNGYYLTPAVVTDADPACRVMQEEIFGPVVTVTPFSSEAEALALANGTSYGLAAMVWTRDLSRAHRVAAALDSGVIWVNCWMLRDLRTPFGGMKQSGVGREGGQEALRFFTEPKNVCVYLGDRP